MKLAFKGTTAECLAHFAKRPGCIEVMSKMLPSAHIRTIERWLKEGIREPVGEYLIRVRVILSELGYEVAEFQALELGIQKACKMFAFDLASIDDLVAEFGYDGSVSGRSQLFKILRDGSGMHPERKQRVEAFIESFDMMIAEVEHAFRERFVHSDTKPTEPLPTREVHLMRHKPSDADKKAVLDSLARTVAAILPLAERVLTDDYTPEDREYIRANAGGTGVFKAANALYRLCGERARTTISSKQ